MHLVAFTLQGYKRFVERTSVKLHGELIALVGPNEAGKTSLLKAMSHLGKDVPFEQRERSRRRPVRPQLEWTFQLETSDLEAIAHIHEAEIVSRAIRIKSDPSEWTWVFEPVTPRRDTSDRIQLGRQLESSELDEVFETHDEFDGWDLETGRLNYAIECCAATKETLLEDEIVALEEVARDLRGYVDFLGELDLNDVSDAGRREISRRMTYLRTQESCLNGLAVAERLATPAELMGEVLKSRLPDILLFEQRDRELSSQYEVSDIADEPPPALMHLAKLGDLDLKALRDEIDGGLTEDVSTRRNRTNRLLKRRFSESWLQGEVAVQFEINGGTLIVQATTPHDDGLSSWDDRSDGMRWFASLLAYAHGWTTRPILLVDEIETHLHYDAQVDLVEVLSTQAFTSKVIATTHSFACLPHDLGTGVRVVERVDNERSRLLNGFWSSGAGFSPLLAAMGAAALSFTPTRHAVLAEGAADAILVPSLLRSSTGQTRLGFQVAPGLASVAARDVGALSAEAGHVVYLVDGDGAGDLLAAKLRDGGADEGLIVRLADSDSGTGLETEDLVDAIVYARAAQDEIRCWAGPAIEVGVEAVRAPFRTKSLAAWCKSQGIKAPDKVPVAQRVADMGAEGRIHNVELEATIADLHESLRGLLGLERQAAKP